MSFSLTTKVTGGEAIIAELRTLQLSALADRLESLLRAIASDAADYSKAPELPGQTYIRTGDLAAGWEGSDPIFQVSGDTLIGSIDNDVSYAAAVQGSDGEQEEIFQGRWRTTDAIADEWEERVAARIESELDEMIAL